MNIRNMAQSDAQQVIDLHLRAFREYYSDNVPRTEQNILACLALNPSGCFVAEENGKLAGYIFSRKLGKLGWIGSFGVDTDCRSKGVGKTLLERAYSDLDKKCEIIGLETFSDSSYNMGLYLKQGFRMIAPMLPLSKTGLSLSPAAPELRAIDAESVSRICKKLLRGIDYGAEARNALEFGWGAPLSAGDSGFCITRLCADKAGKHIHANPLVCRSGGLLPFVKALENYTLAQGAQKIIIPLHSTQHSALKLLLDNGYKITKNRVRMVKKGCYGGFPAIDASHWGMVRG
ncbi:MAG: GNAT family N-acetyltransferase [Elusimicrobiales bacterium]|nr:GNAT family N-acetyltransferase [Elusimicrobiales bacterium]